MIIEALFNLIYKIFSGIFSGINIPPAPADFESALVDFLGYLEFSSNLINLVLPINLDAFFSAFFALFAFEKLYPVVMWILRKIPILNIK